MESLRKQPPVRLIALGFLAVILIGSLLLMLPISVKDGIRLRYIDALYTSTSAVCVTGLVAVDLADTFTVFGCVVVAFLIQIGGLGVTSVGVGLILLAGKKIGMRERLLVKEAMNCNSLRGIIALVKNVLIMTFFFEFIGMGLNYIVFSKDHSPLDALGISAFHSIAAFNNSGFDIVGGMRGLTPYRDNVLLNLTTCGLVIFGGLGFFVILDILKQHRFSKFSLHTKIVLTTSAALILSGALLLKATENISWMGAFFFSISARTAGFNTYPMSVFTKTGLLTLIMLMFIGASPGSTGGGIKTSTFFVLLQAARSSSTNKHCTAFHRTIPRDVIYKAFMVTMLAATVVLAGTFLLCLFEPDHPFLSLLFEATSAYGTVGLSTGITPGLSPASKMVSILTMYIGRLGPLTVFTLWSFRPLSGARYSEETVTIG